MSLQAFDLSPNMIVNWLVPNIGQRQIQHVDTNKLSQVCLQLTTDGYSTQFMVDHKLAISAADLTAGYPLVEIINPQTNPIPASTGATHTTLTGTANLLGVTVASSLTNFLILAFSTPQNAPGAVIQVLLTRNPASPIPTF